MSFIINGGDVSSRDLKGNTAIIIASGRGKTDVIKILLDHGANPEDITAIGLFEGKSALSWACSQGRPEAVALLLQAGANPHFPATKGVFLGKTPLMWASSQGKTDVVRLLISAGVDVNYASPIGNFKGKNSLMWASSQGRFDIVSVLLEAGADINAIDADGVSALMWASGSEASGADGYKKGLMEKPNKGNIDVVKKLLQYGGKPDLVDKDGITAIMYASFHGHSGAVEVLLNHGADASVKNKAGKTALQLAINTGFTDTAQIIINGPTILSLPIVDMMQVSTCGWILYVLREPYGIGVYPVDVTKAYTNFSLQNSCIPLIENGLNTYLGDLLYITSESSIDEVISHLQNPWPTFASKVRAKSQLTSLMKKFNLFLSGNGVNAECIYKGNYALTNCTS
eukprot:gene21116-27362_t